MKTHLDLDLARSRAAAAAVRAVDKSCFENALAALVAVHYGQPADAVHYVEGWVVWDYFPHAMQHGWLEVGGKIVDPTPSYHDESKRLLKDSWARTYFAGSRFTHADVGKIFAALKSVSLPLSSWETPQRRLGARAKASYAAYLEAQASYMDEAALAFFRMGRSAEEATRLVHERIERLAGKGKDL